MGAEAESGGSRPEVEVDQGMRHWYHSCPCCLSAAYPEVKRALDRERTEHEQRSPSHAD